MTAEEKREWIRILFEKVLTIHEQDKHYASVEISNTDGSTFVSVTAMEDGFAIGKKYDFYKYCIMDLDTKELPIMVELLDNLIENKEAAVE